MIDGPMPPVAMPREWLLSACCPACWETADRDQEQSLATTVRKVAVLR
jgi:hypothetical protein